MPITAGISSGRTSSARRPLSTGLSIALWNIRPKMGQAVHLYDAGNFLSAGRMTCLQWQYQPLKQGLYFLYRAADVVAYGSVGKACDIVVAAADRDQNLEAAAGADSGGDSRSDLS